MKLKQKLAAVLAASMIATAVPVVTYADSAARVTKTVTVTEDTTYLKADKDKAPELVIALKDGFTTGSAIYLELDGATWNDGWAKDAAADRDDQEFDYNKLIQVKGVADPSQYVFKTKKISDTELEVKLESKGTGDDLTNESIYIPLLTTLEGGEASVSIDGNGTNIRSEKVVFGNAVDAEIAVSVGKETSVFDEGTIADIVIEEATPGAFKDAETIEITLEHPDFEFSKKGTLTGSKGSEGKMTGAEVKIDKKDPQTLVVTLPTDKTTSNGKITLSGVVVESTVRNPEEGELKVYVSGKNIENTTMKVADITESDVTVVVDEKNVKEIKGGDTATAKLTLKETKADAFDADREVFFTLSNGYIAKYEGEDDEEKFTEFEESVKETLKKSTGINTENIELDINKYDEVIGFSIKLNEVDDSKIEKINVEFDYTVDVNVAGDVSVKVESRMLDKDFEVVVGKVSVPFTVTAETAELLAGKKDQVGGKIVIKEEEKRMIEAGTIKIALEEDDYIRFADKTPEVNVTAGDLKIGEVEVNRNGELEIEVVRPSRTASTIEISGFNFDVNRMIPNGDYSAYVYVNGNKVEQRNFIEIIEEVKEESTIAANGLKKGTAKFVIGSTNFTVNEEAKTMDAAPYVSEKGRTMLPVRYVSEAFGLTENEIIFSSLNGVGTVTIFAGNRTLQLQNNSNVALLNGVQVPMEESVVMKQGRTYVPVGEVGRLLGIEVEWDQATQTATFTNK